MKTVDQQQEPTLRDLLLLLKRGLPFALAVAIGAAALTYFLSDRLAPEYEASATLLASRPNSNLQGSFGVSLVTAPVIDISAYQAAATSSPVLRDALGMLGVEATASDLRDFEELVSVRVENAQQSSLLHIVVKNADPEMAARAANALSNAMLLWDTRRATQNLQTVVDTLESQLRALNEEIAQLSVVSQVADPVGVDPLDGLLTLRAERANQLNAARALMTSAVGHLEVLEPALPPPEAVSPR